MQVAIVSIGNLGERGIPIPLRILQQLDIRDCAELTVVDGELRIRPAKAEVAKTRYGWGEAFARMRQQGDDRLLVGNLQEDFEWEW